jgi:hypothetical protein
MQHRMLIDVLIVTAPVALIFFPEFVERVVQRLFGAKE